MSDTELISNYKDSEKESERKIIKANFIFHNIKDENVILPVRFKKLKDLIQYEYSLNDSSIKINDFKIYYDGSFYFPFNKGSHMLPVQKIVV